MTNANATEEPWDLCVLGAGPAGYAAAMRAHDLGKRVVVVEAAGLGGAGITAGALSSKTMWHLSNDYAGALRTDRGYAAASVDVSYPKVVACVRGAVEERKNLLERQLVALATPNASGGVVSLVHGRGRFVARNTVEVTHPDGSTSRIDAARFLVATGSKPRVPDGIVVDGERIVTSDQIETLPAFPESLVIVGAGVVGCEYATVFANFRRTKVSIIDRQPRILPFEDADVADVVARSFEAAGVHIHREAKLESLRVVDGMVEYVVSCPDGTRETLRVERALVAVGRIPNTAELGLDVAGVEVEKGGSIKADMTRTTAPHVWAAGDVTMDIALVNVAELEGRYAVEQMFGLGPRPLQYEALSAIMFLRPEVASCGINESMAKKKGIPYRVACVDNRMVSRNVAMRNTTGFVKLLAARDDDTILGLRVVGPQASSTIQGIAFLIHVGATLQDIDHCVHPHPAIPEGVQEAARVLLGRSILKPEVFGAEGLLRRGEG